MNSEYRRSSTMPHHRRNPSFSSPPAKPRPSRSFSFSSPSTTGMVSAKNIMPGTKVWVEDPKIAWEETEIVEIFEQEMKVITKMGEHLCLPFHKVHPIDPDAQHGVEDMTSLTLLSEPAVLYNLGKRYENECIYTYSGNILIALNPFTRLPHLYNLQMMEHYRGAPFKKLSPHVFAIADTAYRTMRQEGQSQSIVVSGESGAGKTETAKFIMQYLAYIGGRATNDIRTVEQQVLQSNPLLEAFGNAKTMRNDNSSRFGKFVEIQFDSSGRISGAAIKTYLLEKSRVVQVAKSERNFHCFYQLCASSEAVSKYKLGEPKIFHYLNMGNTYELYGTSYAEAYYNTCKAMDIVGISSDEQESIFKTLAGILHLGNINFSPGKEHDSSNLKDKKSLYHLQAAAELFRCNPKELESTLCQRVIATPEGNITKFLDPSAAITNRDTLAKTIYSRLFEWMVDKINKSIGQDRDSTTQISVLDIYGFESFESNSFEQFCINLANEKLQQHFNQHVFKMEQDHYNKEQINWSFIEFVDNQDVLDLIEKKSNGIISVLDDCCKLPMSKGNTFASKLHEAFRSHDCYRIPKHSQSEFSIYHYAGEVTYCTDSFLEKNKDYVVWEHQNLMSSSKCPFVADLFPPVPVESPRSSSKLSSIATKFKHQLQSLMNTLSCTDPHFIRCIKPNAENKSWEFDNIEVLNQLCCGGVLDAVRISSAGFPTRCMYDKFLDRFRLLAPNVINGCQDTRAAVEKLIKKLNLQKYELGKTMIFLRTGQMVELECQRTEVLNNAARTIQRWFQTYLARKEFLQKRKAALYMQAFCRGCLARSLYKARREATAVVIQKNIRMWFQKLAYGRLCSAAILIQTEIRSSICCTEYTKMKRSKAAVIIQKNVRRWLQQMLFTRLCSAAILIQAGVRSGCCRAEYHKRKHTAATIQAFNEKGPFQDVKSKVTTCCKELSWYLELEKQLHVAAEESKRKEVMKLQSAFHEMQDQLRIAALNFRKEKEKTKELQSQLECAVRGRMHALENDQQKIMELKKESEYLKASKSSLQRKALQLQGELSKARIEFEEWQKKLDI